MSNRDKIIEIYKTKMNFLRGHASKKLGTIEYVDDVIQDAFCKILSKDDAYLEKIDNILGFIVTTITTTIFDKFRKDNNDSNPRLFSTLKSKDSDRYGDVDFSFESYITSLSTDNNNSEPNFINNEFMVYIKKHLDLMGNKHKSNIFMDSYFYGIKAREISERDNMSIGGITSLNRLTRLYLKDKLENELQGELDEFL